MADVGGEPREGPRVGSAAAVGGSSRPDRMTRQTPAALARAVQRGPRPGRRGTILVPPTPARPLIRRPLADPSQDSSPEGVEARTPPRIATASTSPPATTATRRGDDPPSSRQASVPGAGAARWIDVLRDRPRRSRRSTDSVLKAGANGCLGCGFFPRALHGGGHPPETEALDNQECRPGRSSPEHRDADGCGGEVVRTVRNAAFCAHRTRRMMTGVTPRPATFTPAASADARTSWNT